MLFKVFMICALLVYYFFFYFDYSGPVPEPSTLKPPPKPRQYKFTSKGLHHFQFEVNNTIAWEHTLPDTYMYSNHAIIPADACYGVPDDSKVPARGEALYEYVKAHPTSSYIRDFKSNDDQTVQQGEVFFFNCRKNRIHSLATCPSGHIFVRGQCQNINICTGQKDGAAFPHPNSNQYFECQNEQDVTRTCPKDTFFRQDRCVPMKDPAYFCRFFPTEHLILDNGRTRMHCERGQPVFKTCQPGKQFFNQNVCESAICIGKVNGAKIPLPETRRDVFRYIPGYSECQDERVVRTVECPQKLSKDVDEYFLPMVFDASVCAVPKFGANVHSDDPDVIVPTRDFSRKLKNWPLSDAYDRLQGYDGKRKLVDMEDGQRISKRFKRESACDNDTDHVPVKSSYKSYFDCATRTTVPCPNSFFFNGKKCVEEPAYPVRLNQLPIFQFSDLTNFNWLTPWDYLGSVQAPAKKPTCSADTEYFELFNICVQPDCWPYTFLRLIPDLGILLPRDKRARCVYDESSSTLSKRDFNADYSYWDQNVSSEPPAQCVPGMNLNTGNYIWDQTVYATCNTEQPFLFCPYTYGIELVPHGKAGVWACIPSPITTFPFSSPKPTVFVKNQIKRIRPADPQDRVEIEKRKNAPPIVLPPEGIEILPGERLNLKILHNKSVRLELRRNVTYPPHVFYEYDDQNQRKATVGPDKSGYLMASNSFTKKILSFPQYKVLPNVQDLDIRHLAD